MAKKRNRLETLTAAIDAVGRRKKTMSLNAPNDVAIIVAALPFLDETVVKEKKLDEEVQLLQKACSPWKWRMATKQPYTETMALQIRNITNALDELEQAMRFTPTQVSDHLDETYTEACREYPDAADEALHHLALQTASRTLEILVREESRYPDTDEWNSLVHEVHDFAAETRLGDFVGTDQRARRIEKDLAYDFAAAFVREQLKKFRDAGKKRNKPTQPPRAARPSLIEQAPVVRVQKPEVRPLTLAEWIAPIKEKLYPIEQSTGNALN